MRAGRSAGTPSTSLSPDARAHAAQHAGEIHDLRLGGGVVNHAHAVGEHGGHQDVLGAGDGGHVELNLGALQVRDLAVYVAAGELEGAAERLQALQVLIDRPHADGAAARKRDVGLSTAGQERAERQHARAHLAHEVIRRLVEGHALRVDLHAALRPRRVPLPPDQAGAAQAPEQRERRADVHEVWHVVDDVLTGRQQRRDKQGERGVFGAADVYGAMQRHAAVGDQLVHARDLGGSEGGRGRKERGEEGAQAQGSAAREGSDQRQQPYLSPPEPSRPRVRCAPLPSPVLSSGRGAHRRNLQEPCQGPPHRGGRGSASAPRSC